MSYRNNQHLEDLYLVGNNINNINDFDNFDNSDLVREPLFYLLGVQKLCDGRPATAHSSRWSPDRNIPEDSGETKVGRDWRVHPER